MLKGGFTDYYKTIGRKSLIIWGIVLGFLMLTGCGTSVKSTFRSSEPSLMSEARIAFLDLHHKVPENAVKIGETSFRNSVFSTYYSYESNLIKARKIAREKGACIVKVVRVKEPDMWNGCYRLDVAYYAYHGAVGELRQFQLQTE